MSAQTLPLAGRIGGFRLPTIGGLRRRWLYGGAGLLLVAAIVTLAAKERSGTHVVYVTAPVVQQTLVSSVTASGTVNPQNEVSVGTQVSGTISQLYVDYNSKVKAGQVLARLDPSTLQAQIDRDRATLAQVQAQASQAGANASGASLGIGVASADALAQNAAVASAQSNAAKAQAALSLEQLTVARDQSLAQQGYLAQNQLDADRSTLAEDRSALAAAQAASAQARAQAQASTGNVGESRMAADSQAAGAQAAMAAVQAAQAILQQDQVNLSHATITSPVNGTIVARDVSVGQTVAASFSTPTLFSIAQNLDKMQVDINVGEPDIGGVRPGDGVAFSVLAYPTRVFQGVVSQVRIAPQTIDNVVSYDVVVLVANNDGALLPGMTANATIDTAVAKNALVVPIAALQWRGANATGSSPWGAVSGSGAAAAIASGSSGTLTTLRHGKPSVVPVRIALVTSTSAAVVPIGHATLHAGETAIVGATGKGAAAGVQKQAHPAGGAYGAMRAIH